MAELVATSPLAAETLPQEIGTVRADAAAPGRLTLITPFRGQRAALETALQSAHGLTLPDPGRAADNAGARVLWFGAGQWLLCGPEPEAALSRCAALTDQSDAWAGLTLSGADACAVLARLVPLDLTPTAFGPGRTAHSTIGHLPASVTCLQDGAFLLMTFRSMAGTLVHEVETAMSGIDARRRLSGPPPNND